MKGETRDAPYGASLLASSGVSKADGLALSTPIGQSRRRSASLSTPVGQKQVWERVAEYRGCLVPPLVTVVAEVAGASPSAA